LMKVCTSKGFKFYHLCTVKNGKVIHKTCMGSPTDPITQRDSNSIELYTISDFTEKLDKPPCRKCLSFKEIIRAVAEKRPCAD
jgi:hypothetical protein